MGWLLAVDVDLSSATIDVGNLIGVGVVLLVTWLAARLVRRALRKVLERIEGIPPDLRTVTVRFAGYVVWFLGIGVALALLGAQIQPVLAVVILIAVVLVLALRGIADNFAAGVLIQTRRPLHVGDEIESSDHVGVVREVNSRAVVVETADGRLVHLPNSDVLANPLVNHTTAGALRSAVEVRMAATDVADARRRVLAAVSSVADVHDEPAPVADLVSVDPERVTFTARFWHEPTNGATVTSAVIEAVAAATRADGGKATVVAPPPPAPLTPPSPL